MSPEFFRVQEHVIPAQHIREYAGATAHTQEEELQLHVKQYTPLDSESLSSDAITIIGAHANGVPKELYEPLWDEIYRRSKNYGFSLRAIWIADVAHQGISSVLNEDKLSSDPSWMDHSRDMLFMINHFRDQMPRPLVGIGHSMGGCQIVNLALMHPRLLTTLVLLDPVIQVMRAAGPPTEKVTVAQASTYRRDIWPSRKAATDSFAKSPFYQAWDKRVLNLWFRYGLRDLPTAIYPDINEKDGSSDVPVTLTTTKHQEVWTFLRPNYKGGEPKDNPAIDRFVTPDLDPTSDGVYPFYRPEPIKSFHNLPFVRPSVLYIHGAKSNLSPLVWRSQKLEFTGIGVGGSGGAKEGRVKSVVLEDVGHFVPMEAVDDSAEHAAKWFQQEMQRYRAEEVRWHELRSQRGKMDDKMVDEEWMKHIGPPPTRERLATAAKL